jgi:RND superfamily putative drug exporter
VLSRLGASCYRRRRLVIVLWVVALAVLGGAAGRIGTNFSLQFSLPDVESARGIDTLSETFGAESSGRSGSIVVRAPEGVNRPEVVQPLSAFFAELDARDDLAVTSPFDPAALNQISRDGTIAFATVNIDAAIETQEEFIAIFEDMTAIAPVIDGVQIEYGGEVFAEFEAPSSEILGLAFAVIILIAAFGSVLAMGLPIGTAFGGIGAGVLVILLASNLVTMPDLSTTLGIMIGLGVGIDYALFIVTRYREVLRRGVDGAGAAAEAINTAGRAVLFAGTTVVISLLGMLLMGVGFMTGLGIGASLTVLMTMAASVTLLPAFLGFAGDRIERTRVRGIVAAGLVAVALVGLGLKRFELTWSAALAVVVLLVGRYVPFLHRELPPRRVKPMRETVPFRWSRWVQRHPGISLVAGTGVLVLLALPVLGLRLGFADEGNYPTDTTTRRAYDLLAEGFGPGFNGPLTLVTRVTAADLPVVEQVSQALATTPGIAQVTPAIPNDPNSPSAVLWRIFPASAPQSQEAADLVAALRDDVLPAATQGSALDVLVTGTVPVNVDFSAYLAARLPTFFGAVLALSFILLMLVFRSLLVPLKAVLMNLLSIGSAYGCVVAVFQWGWGAGLLGLGTDAPIDPWLPVMMFAIVFGLSMDYEVFLLSRVKEEYDRDGDNEAAVADGLAHTARVITAAAAIMVFVFGSFVLDGNRSIKMFGFGLAVAVFLDASVVRMLLVPATMQLLGDRNWWLPRWLQKVLPRIDVEGTHATPVPSAGK